jgi:amino acid transporter
VGVALILVSYALFNHFGIRLTTLLTDFSGYWIFIVAILLTVALIAFALIAGQGLDLSRLFTLCGERRQPITPTR